MSNARFNFQRFGRPRGQGHKRHDLDNADFAELRYEYGLTAPAIAKELDVTVATVYRRLLAYDDARIFHDEPTVDRLEGNG